MSTVNGLLISYIILTVAQLSMEPQNGPYAQQLSGAQ